MNLKLISRVVARALPVVLGAILALSACGGSRRVGDGDMPRGERNLITSAELQGVGANNLYDAIVKLRPDYLRVRSANLSAVPVPSSAKGSGPPPEQSASVGTAVAGGQVPIRVYQNDQLLSGVEELRQIPISSVQEVRFVPGPQAGVRYGTNHANGVILVKSK